MLANGYRSYFQRIFHDVGWIALFACHLISAGCYTEGTLKRHRAQWERRKPSAYSFELEVRCFCPEASQGPFRIVVKSDTIRKVNDLPYIEGQYRLIEVPDKYFGRALRFLRRKPDRRRMEFDPHFGFIRNAFFDPRLNRMDDELHWSMRDFHVIDP